MGWFSNDATISTWRDAEVNAARLMKTWGYLDAKVTVGGADSGLDVISRDAVAQVKHHSKPVGRPELQRLVGASQGARMIFFSRSGYSTHAVKFADTCEMALFSYDIAGFAHPVNHDAKLVSKHGPGPHYDFFDRTVISFAPGLERYVQQRRLWTTAVISILGVVVVPGNYWNELGPAKTILTMCALMGCGALAIFGLRRGAETDAQKTRRIAHPQESDPVGETTAFETWVAEHIRVALFVGLTLLIAPLALQPIDPNGWWWLLCGLGWILCWTFSLALIGEWFEQHPETKVGYWVWSMIGVVFVILPIAAFPLNGGGWWWSLYVPAWIFCWLLAFGAISSSIEEIRKTDPKSP